MIDGWKTHVSCLVLLLTCFAAGSGAVVFDKKDEARSLCLNGDWRFRLVHADSGRSVIDSFARSDFDDRGWDVIRVPSNWELRGFEDARYFSPDPKKYGLYRLTVKIPESWRGRQVWLNFEGVAFAYTVYVNGSEAGSFAHAFLPAQFDITSLIGASGTVTVAVKVVRDLRENSFDTNDDWALSGIYRDVYLFSPSEYHINTYTVNTRMDRAGTTATLEGQVDVRFFRSQRDTMSGTRTPVKPLSLRVTLAEPGGRVVHDTAIPVTQRHPLILPSPEFRITVPKPRLWTAEEPNLYDLTLTLAAGGKTMQTVRTRVGLRTVAIENGVLKVNGRPVKLRGVCRHETHPDAGRAFTEDLWRQDIRLIKAANINAVRTSHYPPNERFIELCDEAGLYVLDEVPIGFGDRYLNIPDMLGTMLARAEETVARDRNHPSVIVWTVGNENPLTVNLEKTARTVKLLDPGRPILYPGGNFNGQPNDRTNTGHSSFIDILSHHYPTDENMEQYAGEWAYRVPWIFTEINHALHNGFDDYRAKWELIEKTDIFAGGMVWLWADQGIRRPVNGRTVYDSYAGPFPKGIDTDAALSGDWRVDANTVIDAHGEYGMDGIVNPDRSPQTDYFETRKIYSPVIVPEDSIAIAAGARTFTVTVENRYDFTGLKTVKCVSEYLVNGKVRETASVPLDCAPRASMKLAVPVPASSGNPTDDRSMRFTFTDRYGVNIYERTVRMVNGNVLATRMKAVETASAADPGSSESGMGWHYGGVTVVLTPDSTFTISRTGDPVIARGPYVRVGRVPTIGERRTYGNLKLEYWMPPLLTHPSGVSVAESRTGGNLSLTIRARYVLPGDQPRSVMSVTALTIRPGGILDIGTELTPESMEGALMEFGLAWSFPGADGVSWLGGGPYPAYPYKETLDEHGVWRVSSGDLFFAGNRRNVEMLRIDGAGAGILTAPSDMGWKRAADGGILLSRNLRVAGLGTKFHPPRQMWRAKDIGTASGTMRWVLSGEGSAGIFGEMFGK